MWLSWSQLLQLMHVGIAVLLSAIEYVPAKYGEKSDATLASLLQ